MTSPNLHVNLTLKLLVVVAPHVHKFTCIYIAKAACAPGKTVTSSFFCKHHSFYTQTLPQKICFQIMSAQINDVEPLAELRKTRKRQFRFSAADDEALLTQVIATFPYKLAHGQKAIGWKRVAAALLSIGLNVDHRRCQERTGVLIDNFRKSESKSRQMSGIDEDFTEIDRLLTELIEMIDDLDSKNAEISEKKATKLKEDEEAAELIRNAALEELKTRF